MRQILYGVEGKPKCSNNGEFRDRSFTFDKIVFEFVGDNVPEHREDAKADKCGILLCRTGRDSTLNFIEFEIILMMI